MSIEAARAGFEASFEEVLSRHAKPIIDSYRLTQTEDEIWITEQVNNLLFILQDKIWLRDRAFGQGLNSKNKRVKVSDDREKVAGKFVIANMYWE